MRLVFYSGEDEQQNFLMNEQLMSLCSKKKPTLAYIPSTSYQCEVEFHDLVSQFKKFGVGKFILFPIDLPFDQIIFREVLNADIIYLGGGNTYYFLSILRKKKLLKHLKAFARSGGVLTGLSAGAILMTPKITTAGYPKFDCDENSPAIKNLKGLDLVQFEFFPHFRNSNRYHSALIKESKKTKYPIYACPDGGGIVVDGDKLTLVGKCFLFHRGVKVNLNATKLTVARNPLLLPSS